MEIETALNYIDGEYLESSTKDRFEVLNPADNRVIGRAQLSSVQDTKDAIDAIYERSDKIDWAFDARKRAAALLKLAEMMNKNKQQLAVTLCLETGKPLRDAEYEIDISVDYITYYAGLARNVFGRSGSFNQTSYSIIAREPMGIVGHIVPWNFPLILLFRALAASLAAGNVTIIKPASYTPLATYSIIKATKNIEEFPRGTINFITGAGGTVGAEMVRSEKVNMIAFTGDNNTGREIMKLSSNSPKKVSLELGGKSPNIIFHDADIGKAVGKAVMGAFSMSGQSCSASSRVLVEKGIQKNVVGLIKERTEALRVGNGLQPGTDVGPIISKNQMDRILQYIEIGRHDSRLVTGGKRIVKGDLDAGNFIEPTIFDDVPFNSRIAQEEIFGPVLSIIPFEGEDEAVRIANSTKFGLDSAIWTNDIKRAFRVARRIKAGTVWINNYEKHPAEAEYGGYKWSGIGRQRGIEGILEFTQQKHIYIDMEQ
ncbi:MAG: aldehyde dehydrogenase [Nitrososphaerota archaeon]|jgi:betaine-aldehyde dehydrogenase|nr:aldehyde dehydrogenase [Nitrososphaerota archaeon]MDG6935492.1 aldehyde dehydrogenase [Nitrososphaerota archaeon]MDG6943520.1 aldehyde dehydrogenase [Nitrososphaerota archaeon]